MASSSRQSRPDTTEWYKIKHARIRQAELSYRFSAEGEWTHLNDAKAVSDTSLSWNVEKVHLSGSGIALIQQYQDYKAPTEGKGGVLEVTEDNFIWRVTFKHGQFTNIYLKEYEKPSSKGRMIELRFTCRSQPQSEDATIRTKPVPTNDAEEGDPETNHEGEDDEGEEGELEVRRLNYITRRRLLGSERPTKQTEPEEPDTSSFPLAQLFKEPAAYLEIRLLFARESAAVKNSYKWIWPAVIYLLAGRQDWTPMTKVTESSKLYGPSAWRLDDMLIAQQDWGAAVFERGLTEDGGSEWLLRPKPPLPARTSVPSTGLAIRTAQSAEQPKRKRELSPDEANKDTLPAKEAALEEAGTAMDNAVTHTRTLEDELRTAEDKVRRLQISLGQAKGEESKARKDWRKLKDEVKDLRDGAEKKRR